MNFSARNDVVGTVRERKGHRVKFGLYGMALGAMTSREAVRVAKLAEDLGYESLWSGEHMALPDPQVPPSHRVPKHRFFDPVVAMAYLAANTTTIKLGLGILILPQRHPVQLAKEITSLDVLTDGRLILGVGVGYLEAEFAAVGVEFSSRGARMNDYLEALRVLWHDDPPRHHGRFVTIDGVDAYPRPQTQGGPPLFVGGNSPAALRRAVKYGSGWIGGLGHDPESAGEAVRQLHLIANEQGRDLSGFEITVGTRWRSTAN